MPVQESTDRWQRRNKTVRHFRALDIDACERKQAHPRFSHRNQGRSAVANPLVSRQHDPSLRAHNREPIFVWGILSEMVIVNFDPRADLTQGVSDNPLSY